APVTGASLLARCWDYLGWIVGMQPFDLARVDYSLLGFLLTVSLPMLGAGLSLLYCLFKPGGRNGGVATLLFVLPVLSALACCLLLWRFQGDPRPGAQMATTLASATWAGLFDPSVSGGLWLSDLGALLMLFARLGRGKPRPRL
ncbi:MAG: hypothetical protein AB7D57_13825, partial [Desulfovibrionaceae bacterium]